MRTILRLLTPATERAVSLNEARRHLRVEDTDQDDLIAAYIEAAEQSLSYVGRSFKPATYELAIYGIGSRYIDLPMPPIRTVTSVSTIGSAGTLAMLDSSAYTLITGMDGRATLHLADLPTFTSGSLWATVVYTAGYDIVPSALRSAVLLVAGTLFENRSGASPIPMTKLPYGVDPLVGPFRELTM